MSLNTNTHSTDGAQQFTLLCKYPDTGNTVICTHLTEDGNDSLIPILTTDQDEVMLLARRLVLMYPDRIYTVCFVDVAIVMNM